MIYYECDVTFVMLEGNVSVSYCLQTGLWSKVSFVCAATCEAPVEIANATIVGVNSTNKDGGMISYQCDTNFKMLPENSSTIIRSTSVCLSNGSWSAVSFQCVPMCSPPLYNYADASAFGIQTPYVPGDTVYFICDPGFQMSPNNVSFTVCLDNGTWSAVNFQCVATCGRPRTILNTHIIRTNIYANTVVAGDVIYYECNQNYSMLPGNTSTSICQPDSSWSAVNFQCAPSCNPPLTNYTNATAVGIKSTYVEGDMVYFVCHSDYIVSMNNVSTTVCQSDGTWSATNFHCVLRCIPRVPVNYIEETENGVLYFRFLAVFDLLTLTEAYTNCNELCGKLIQFDRYEKFEIVQNEFKADTGYDGEHYWIDAQFDSTVSEWKTVNGTIVESDSTQTTDMWKNGNAKDGSPPCACMNYVSHFQLYDIDCASTLRSVCERHPYY